MDGFFDPEHAAVLTALCELQNPDPVRGRDMLGSPGPEGGVNPQPAKQPSSEEPNGCTPYTFSGAWNAFVKPSNEPRDAAHGVGGGGASHAMLFSNATEQQSGCVDTEDARLVSAFEENFGRLGPKKKIFKMRLPVGQIETVTRTGNKGKPQTLWGGLTKSEQGNKKALSVGGEELTGQKPRLKLKSGRECEENFNNFVDVALKRYANNRTEEHFNRMHAAWNALPAEVQTWMEPVIQLVGGARIDNPFMNKERTGWATFAKTATFASAEAAVVCMKYHLGLIVLAHALETEYKVEGMSQEFVTKLMDDCRKSLKAKDAALPEDHPDKGFFEKRTTPPEARFAPIDDAEFWMYDVYTEKRPDKKRKCNQVEGFRFATHMMEGTPTCSEIVKYAKTLYENGTELIAAHNHSDTPPSPNVSLDLSTGTDDSNDFRNFVVDEQPSTGTDDSNDFRNFVVDEQPSTGTDDSNDFRNFVVDEQPPSPKKRKID